MNGPSGPHVLYLYRCPSFLRHYQPQQQRLLYHQKPGKLRCLQWLSMGSTNISGVPSRSETVFPTSCLLLPPPPPPPPSNPRRYRMYVAVLYVRCRIYNLNRRFTNSTSPIRPMYIPPSSLFKATILGFYCKILFPT